VKTSIQEQIRESLLKKKKKKEILKKNKIDRKKSKTTGRGSHGAFRQIGVITRF